MHLPLEDDDRPPYIQAAEVLRNEIAAGRLKPGDKLPSARALQERYGIASSTVQNALRVLKSEGLVYSVQGRGSYVRQGAKATEPISESPLTPTRASEDPEGEARSDEYGELAERVQALTDQVEQLTALVHRLLQQTGKAGPA